MNSRKPTRKRSRLLACLAGMFMALLPGSTAQSAQDSPPRDPPGITEPLLAPVIVTQPLDAVLSLGDNTDFKVEALGAKPLYFQWRRDGTKLEGQTADTLKIRKATALDAGAYAVVVSNSFGAVIRDNEHIRRIEQPVYKRRWDEQWKVSNRWLAENSISRF